MYYISQERDVLHLALINSTFQLFPICVSVDLPWGSVILCSHVKFHNFQFNAPCPYSCDIFRALTGIQDNVAPTPLGRTPFTKDSSSLGDSHVVYTGRSSSVIAQLSCDAAAVATCHHWARNVDL